MLQMFTRSAMAMKLFVGGLSYEITTDDLRDAFSQFGPIIDAVVLIDRRTGNSRGSGFVTFAEAADADRALIEMNRSALAGRRIRVSRKAVLDAQEADELREYHERSQTPPADGFGSLADKLRSVFEPPKR